MNAPLTTNKKSRITLIVLAASRAGAVNLDCSLVNTSIIPISRHFKLSTSVSYWVLIIPGLIAGATPMDNFANRDPHKA